MYKLIIDTVVMAAVVAILVGDAYLIYAGTRMVLEFGRIL